MENVDDAAQSMEDTTTQTNLIDQSPKSILVIRRFQRNDTGNVHGLIRDGIVELSRIANARSFKHPIAWGAWMLMTSILVQLWNLRTGKTFDLGILIMALFVCGMCVMIGINFYHESLYDNEMKIIFNDKNIMDIETYFGIKKRNSSNQKGSEDSTFLVIQLDDDIIGCIGLDASNDENQTIDQDIDTARIVHFIIEKKYRGGGLGRDLLHQVMLHAKSKNKIKNVIVSTSTLQDQANLLFKSKGFKKIPLSYQRLGIFGIKRGQVKTSVEKYFKLEETEDEK